MEITTTGTGEVLLNSRPKISKNTPYNSNLALNHQNYEVSTSEALKNISNTLLDENIDEDTNVYPDKLALQAVERSYYDIIGQTYPPCSISNLPQSNWPKAYANLANHIQNESLPVTEFKRGMEEGLKFLPSFACNKLAVNLHTKRDDDSVGRKLKEREEKDKDHVRLKGKKNAHSEDWSLVEGRKSKICVLNLENLDDQIDSVFLGHEQLAKEARRLRETMQNETKRKGKKIHESLVDLRALLVHCSQAIAINDTQNANQVIKQIRMHSFPDGDGVQRMAHIFIKALEARLNIISNEPYRKVLVSQETETDYLDAYSTCLVSSPVLIASQYFANHTTLNAIGKATKLHIINLGAAFRFHWPCLIHELSKRKGGPPKLRITNIEAQVSRYSPNDRIEPIRQKLASVCTTFGVPLEYRGIYTKWDNINVDDLNIEKDEVLIVNSFHGSEYLGDEADSTYSPKNRVLDIIRHIKPHVFIQGIVNGSYDSSLFVDRFKQMLLYSSAKFDLLDATIPRGSKQRRSLENAWGLEVANVIACEGSERFVRPETYKLWHNRYSRAGFEELPLDQVIFKRIKDTVREVYHESFFIEDDKNWLLVGWKGRVMNAFSAWYPSQTR